MQRLTFTLLLMACCLLGFGQAHKSTIKDQIDQRLAGGAEFPEVQLFQVNNSPELRVHMDKVLEKAVFLNLDVKELQKAFNADHEAIRFVIPNGQNGNYVINAIKNDLFTESFKVTTPDGEFNDYYLGKFYKGIVEGSDHTLATISIFKDEVVAIFSTEKTGNLVLGEMELDRPKASRPYVLYDDKDFMVNFGFECETPDKLVRENSQGSNTDNSTSVNPDNCLKWYFECDYDMFLEEGSIQATVNKMTAIFNEIEAVYSVEAINSLLDGIFVWVEEDGYVTGNSPATVAQFAARRTPLPGNANVAHLVSRGYNSNQGIANSIGGICPDRAYFPGSAHALNATTNTTAQPFPIYSFVVFLICHENGHIVGSFHTHACRWGPNYPQEGGDRIDDCGNFVNTEGAACFDPDNPIIPEGEATIMSYCPLINVGVNFQNGFADQPSDIIRSFIYDETCADPCGIPCPIVNGTAQNLDCGNENTGLIDLVVSGGAPPYTFNWSNGATTEDISNLGPGEYTVTVTNSSGGCQISRSFTVIAPNAIFINGTTSPDQGGGTGSIDINVSGGTPPYSYQWSNGASTQDISGLTAGDYTVTVSDNGGCSETETFTVVNESGCQVVINEFPFQEGFESGDLGVFGQGRADDFNWQANSGSTPTGRTGPSSAAEGSFYAYTEATGNTPGKTAILLGCFDFTGLSGPQVSFAYHMYGSNVGSLSLVVVDTDNAQSATVWTETSNQGAFWQTTSVNLSAFAGKNVELQFVSTTGLGSSDRSDIAVDDILVEVGAACDPPVLSFNTSPADCFGEATGSASVNATGGVPPYSYAWSNGSSSSMINNVVAGNYEVTVTDATGCTETGTATVTSPPAIDLDFFVIGESSPGASDGEIDLSVAGGVPPYSYAWSNGANTQDIDGLSEGIYLVTVTDDNGCTETGSAEVVVGSSGTCNGEGLGLPVDQNFEFGLGEFENAGDFDWIRNSGSTPTRRTGPSSAFEGSFYAYAEANGNQFEQAILLSPCLDLSGANATVNFAYHMYGVTVGSLALEVSENGGPDYDQLWVRNGDQGNQWFTASVDLSAYSGRIVRIRFVATIGGGGVARSDIAIDAVDISTGGSSAGTNSGNTGLGSSGSGSTGSGSTGSGRNGGDNDTDGGIFGGGSTGGGSYGGSFGGWFGFKDNTADLQGLSIESLVPVPAINDINIKVLASSDREGTIRVLDYMGRVIDQGKRVFQKGESNFTIDVSNLPSGLYFMSIESEDSRSLKKFEVIK